jgi:hypothetical protein
MQWYVYLVTVSAIAFLSKTAAELVSRPIRIILGLRRIALERVITFGKVSLPQPRELAISSLQIREYDQAVRNVMEAQRTFGDLGIRLLAMGENEPVIRTLTGLLGLNLVRAGETLINLSEAYQKAKIDSEEHRRAIATAVLDTRTALAAFRGRCPDSLMMVQVEPINLLRGYRRQTMRAKPVRHTTTAPRYVGWSVTDKTIAI